MRTPTTPTASTTCRPLVMHAMRRIDIHMDEPTSRIVRQAFSYIFETPPAALIRRCANELRLAAGRLCRIEGPGGAIEAMPFDLDHGDIGALGFRFGGLAYTPDLKRIPEASRAVSRGARRLDRRRPALPAASVAFQPRRSAGGIEHDAPAPRGPHQPAHRSRLRNAAQAPAGACRCRPTTACASRDSTLTAAKGKRR